MLGLPFLKVRNGLIPTLWHFGRRQSYGDGKKASGCQGLGEGEGWTGEAQRIFRAVNLLNDIVMVDTFVPIYTIYNTKNESWYKLGTWVIMMCQNRFLNCNKCTTLVGDVDKGGWWWWVYRGRGQEHSVVLWTKNFSKKESLIKKTDEKSTKINNENQPLAISYGSIKQQAFWPLQHTDWTQQILFSTGGDCDMGRADRGVVTEP